MTLTRRLHASLLEHAPEALSPPFAAIAWSGGADSTALLIAYLRLLQDLFGSPLPSPVLALHLDHQLRKDSTDDARWCQNTADAHGADLQLCIQTLPEGPQIAAEQSALEEKTRLARYQLQAQALKTHRRNLLLTAHHAHDNLESLLLALSRGSGLTGVAGIRPRIPMNLLTRRPEDAPFQAVRPLLTEPRESLRVFLKKQEQTWREDQSNQVLDRTRNIVRHKILPELLALHGSSAPALRTPLVLHRDRTLLEKLAADALDQARLPPFPGAAQGSVPLDRQKLQALNPGLGAHVLRLALREAGLAYAPSTADTDRILADIHNPNTRGEIQITGATLDLDRNLVLLEQRTKKRPPPPAPQDLMPGKNAQWGPFSLETSVKVREKNTIPLESHADVENFDLDRLTLPLRLRTKLKGETMTLFGGGLRKIGRILADSRVPRVSRPWTPVLADANNNPLWLVPWRRANLAPIGPETTRVLTIKWRRKGTHGTNLT